MWNTQLEQHLLDFDSTSSAAPEKNDDNNEQAEKAQPAETTNDSSKEANLDHGQTIFLAQKFTYILKSPWAHLLCFSIGSWLNQTTIITGQNPFAFCFRLVVVVAVILFVGTEKGSQSLQILLAKKRGFEGHASSEIKSKAGENPISKKDIRARLDRASISKWLGALGAPPLSISSSVGLKVANDETFADDDDEEKPPVFLDPESDHHKQQDRLEDFFSSPAAFLDCVDQQMQVLKMATRIQLGMGWKKAHGVDHVERAAMGRRIRSHGPSAASAVLSFGTLRKFWFVRR